MAVPSHLLRVFAENYGDRWKWTHQQLLLQLLLEGLGLPSAENQTLTWTSAFVPGYFLALHQTPGPQRTRTPNEGAGLRKPGELGRSLYRENLHRLFFPVLPASHVLPDLLCMPSPFRK